MYNIKVLDYETGSVMDTIAGVNARYVEDTLGVKDAEDALFFVRLLGSWTVRIDNCVYEVARSA